MHIILFYRRWIALKIEHNSLTWKVFCHLSKHHVPIFVVKSFWLLSLLDCWEIQIEEEQLKHFTWNTKNLSNLVAKLIISNLCLMLYSSTRWSTRFFSPNWTTIKTTALKHNMKEHSSLKLCVLLSFKLGHILRAKKQWYYLIFMLHLSLPYRFQALSIPFPSPSAALLTGSWEEKYTLYIHNTWTTWNWEVCGKSNVGILKCLAKVY